MRPKEVNFFFLPLLLDPLDINPSVDFLFDCGLVGPEDVSTEQDLPRAMRKVRTGVTISTKRNRTAEGVGLLSEPCKKA